MLREDIKLTGGAGGRYATGAADFSNRGLGQPERFKALKNRIAPPRSPFRLPPASAFFLPNFSTRRMFDRTCCIIRSSMAPPREALFALENAALASSGRPAAR